MSEPVEATLTLGRNAEKGHTTIIISVGGGPIWTGHLTDALTEEEVIVKGVLSFPNHLARGDTAYDVHCNVNPKEGIYLHKDFGSGALGTFKSKEIRGLKPGDYDGKGLYTAA